MIYVILAVNAGKFLCVLVLLSDINECTNSSTTAGQAPCGPGTVCVNVPGSYRCSHLSEVGCTDLDPATGHCLDVRPAFCQPGMTYNSTDGQCVGRQKPDPNNKDWWDVSPST